jgi:hypothetical protein
VSAKAEQEAEESMALEVFRLASGLLPGQVTRVQQDPPDFLVTNGGRSAAVEMTRYHRDAGPGGSEGAKHETLERRVVATAQSLFEASEPIVRLSVSPFFREGMLRRSNIQQVAEQLAKLVTQILPSVPSDADRLSSSRAEWIMIDQAGLGEVLIGLTVVRWGPTMRGMWQAPVAGHMNTDVFSIERPIRAKEKGLRVYKSTVDECWLIIYSPVMHASSFFDFEVLTPNMFSSDFDHIVFIDPSMGQYVLVA